MSLDQIVLCIDDNKFAHRFTEKALADHFTCEHAYSGEEGLDLATGSNPSVILLDVEMPGMNGYEVCDKLKHTPETSNIPVVFISSRGDLRDRMQGYEVGGADYIIKPFDANDLLAKVNVLIRISEQRRSLQAKVEEARRTAFTALSGTSELGQVMMFVEKSYGAKDYATLTNQLFNVTQALGLKATIAIDAENGPQWFSCAGTINPLEANVMELLRERSRFQDFGCRTQVNYPHIALLVKNMPLDDMERYGRIKDLLPALLGAADARISALNTETALYSQSRQINDAILSIRETLNHLSQSLTSNQTKGTSVLREMFYELNQNLPRMALEQDQEDYILERIDQATHQAMKLVDTGNDLNAAFSMVLGDLENLADKQNNLIDEVSSLSSSNDDDGEDDIMSVELF